LPWRFKAEKRKVAATESTEFPEKNTDRNPKGTCSKRRGIS